MNLPTTYLTDSSNTSCTLELLDSPIPGLSSRVYRFVNHSIAFPCIVDFVVNKYAIKAGIPFDSLFDFATRIFRNFVERLCNVKESVITGYFRCSLIVTESLDYFRVYMDYLDGSKAANVSPLPEPVILWEGMVKRGGRSLDQNGRSFPFSAN